MPLPPFPQQAAAQGAPAIGAPGVSFPTPRLGSKVQGLQKLRQAVKLLQDALPLVGADTPEGKATMKSLSDLVKHIPQGVGGPDTDARASIQSAQQTAQQGPAIAALQQAQQQRPGMAA